MNIIQKIKLLFKLREFFNKLKEGGKFMEGTNKPGWKTTEFWLVVISNLITIIIALNGVISPEKATTIITILNGVYAVLRSLVKQPSITTIVENK